MSVSFRSALRALCFASSLVASTALAHPVDDPCRPDQVTEDGCQPIIPALGLHIPEFFAAHKRYWHCRREIVVTDIIPIARCDGAVEELEWQLGIPHVPPAEVEALLGYWNLIPAHPELDFPGQVWRAVEQTEACQANRNIAGVVLHNCRAYKSFLSLQVWSKLHAPPPTCVRKKSKCVLSPASR